MHCFLRNALSSVRHSVHVRRLGFGNSTVSAATTSVAGTADWLDLSTNADRLRAGDDEHTTALIALIVGVLALLVLLLLRADVDTVLDALLAPIPVPIDVVVLRSAASVLAQLVWGALRMANGLCVLGCVCAVLVGCCSLVGEETTTRA